MFTDILQPTHLIFVLVVALLVLGPKRLPEVGRSLGRGLRDFRSAMSGEDHDEVAAETPAMNLATPEPAHQPAPGLPAEPAADHVEPVTAHAEPAVDHAEPAVDHVEPVTGHAEPAADHTESQPGPASAQTHAAEQPEHVS